MASGRKPLKAGVSTPIAGSSWADVYDEFYDCDVANRLPRDAVETPEGYRRRPTEGSRAEQPARRSVAMTGGASCADLQSRSLRSRSFCCSRSDRLPRTPHPTGRTSSAARRAARQPAAARSAPTSNLSVTSNEDGSDGPPCLEIFTYSISSNGRFTVVSDEFGCASSGTMAVGADLSVTLGATEIPLDSCSRRNCSPSRTVTVSASDSPTGPSLDDDHALDDQVRRLHDQDDHD